MNQPRDFTYYDNYGHQEDKLETNRTRKHKNKKQKQSDSGQENRRRQRNTVAADGSLRMIQIYGRFLNMFKGSQIPSYARLNYIKRLIKQTSAINLEGVGSYPRPIE